MSKLGKKIYVIPKESTVKVEGVVYWFLVQKGSQKILLILKYFLRRLMIKMNFRLLPVKKDKKTSLMWGTYRSLINNAVLGVTEGHNKYLELNGVGFRANLKVMN